MSEIIAIANQKGGVGKTTTAFSLGVALRKQGNKVLLIDADPQGDLTTCMGYYNQEELQNTIATLMSDTICDNEFDAEKSILHHKEGIDLIPSNLDLSAIEFSLVNAMSREFTLKNAIKDIKDNYDYIIIDCPPALGIITTNALTASDSVIIPVQCEFFALEGITQLLKAIMYTQANLNPNLTIEGVLLTMLDARTNLGLEVVEEIRSYFKDKVYNTIIPRLIRLTEAPSHGKPIVAYDPKSRGSEAYLNLAKEVIKGNGTN